jgi:hypothetical protein
MKPGLLWAADLSETGCGYHNTDFPSRARM